MKEYTVRIYTSILELHEYRIMADSPAYAKLEAKIRFSSMYKPELITEVGVFEVVKS